MTNLFGPKLYATIYVTFYIFCKPTFEIYTYTMNRK